MAYSMLDYTGIKCPVCGRPFKENDDIVVCPECGAPYHRACYQQKGSCIFTDLHAAKKDWQPPRTESTASAAVKDLECPNCGTLNDHGAQFCTRCGIPLSGGQNHTQQPRQNPGQGQWQSPYQNAYRQGQPSYGANGVPFAFDPMGGVSPAEELAPGVSFGDASKYVKQNTNYYMGVFRYVSRTGRIKFNFAAFLFSGAWLIYRKQYKLGVAITALMFALFIGLYCTLYLVSMPELVNLAIEAGYSSDAILSLSYDQLLSISTLASESLLSTLKISSPFLVFFAMSVVMLVIGIMGNKIYMNGCIKNVRDWHAMLAAGQGPLPLDKIGGVNYPAVISITVCYFIIRTFLPLLFI